MVFHFVQIWCGPIMQKYCVNCGPGMQARPEEDCPPCEKCRIQSQGMAFSFTAPVTPSSHVWLVFLMFDRFSALSFSILQ